MVRVKRFKGERSGAAEYPLDDAVSNILFQLPDRAQGWHRNGLMQAVAPGAGGRPQP